MILATGEAISHLNYLIGEGEVTSETDPQGVRWYRMRDQV
jgi:hypothetical protein